MLQGNRVVLVTGAGGGIGAATARLLAAGGTSVAICGRRKQPLQLLAAEIDALPLGVDVRSAEEVNAAVAQVTDKFGRLDGVVLNAGTTHSETVQSITDVEWSATMATNLDGAMTVARACLPHLENASGALVSVSSVAAVRASAGGSAYSASKAALQMLTATIAVEYARRGVRANTVAPGWVRTDMADSEMDAVARSKGISRERAYELATTLVPQGRPAAPAEIAEAIVWLLSPAASYVTGTTLFVDGGLTVADPGTVLL